MRKTKLDDEFYSYLTEGADFVGEPGIPMLLDLRNSQIPRALVPFDKIGQAHSDKRSYVHFYIYDNRFTCILTK